MINETQEREWRTHPVTMQFVETLKQAKLESQSNPVYIPFSVRDTAESVAMLAAYRSGAVKAIDQVLDYMEVLDES